MAPSTPVLGSSASIIWSSASPPSGPWTVEENILVERELLLLLGAPRSNHVEPVIYRVESRPLIIHDERRDDDPSRRVSSFLLASLILSSIFASLTCAVWLATDTRSQTRRRRWKVAPTPAATTAELGAICVFILWLFLKWSLAKSKEILGIVKGDIVFGNDNDVLWESLTPRWIG